MKKTLALLLILALAFTLCACGGKTVVGTWESQRNVTDVMGDSDSPIAQYMADVNILVRLELREDMSFTLLMDGTAMVPALRDAVKSYLEDIYAANGKSLEEAAAASGMTIDQIIDLVLEGQDTADLTRSISGTYTVEGETVTLSFESGSSREGTWNKDTLFIHTDELGDITFTRK